MSKYKVIALSVGGLGNKIYSAGDIVTEANFPAGNAANLVKGGYLELIPETANPQASTETPTEQPATNQATAEEVKEETATTETVENAPVVEEDTEEPKWETEETASALNLLNQAKEESPETTEEKMPANEPAKGKNKTKDNSRKSGK